MTKTIQTFALRIAALILIGLQTAAPAQELAREVEFNIAPQPLAAAVIRFSEQSGIQLVTAGEDVSGLKTAGVSGRHSISSALDKLLAGTRLSFTKVGESTVALVGAASRTSQEVGVQGLRVAQEGGVSPQEGSKDAASADAPQSAAEDARSAREGSVEEVIVTGTHIRGVTKIAQPSFNITREEIDKAGFNTVEDLVEKLPQNFNIVTPLGRAAGSLSNNTISAENSVRVTAIDLRGLGAESTLTLINGRRRVGSEYGRVVDISTIPLSAIERVEVLTGGASAIYGADAVAGVVNFTTRREFQGGETRVSYGGPSEYGGGNVFNASHIQGFDFADGSLVAAYDYEQRAASNLLDTGHSSSERLLNGRRYLYRFSEADVTRHSAYVAGRLGLGDRAEFYGDLFYTDKEVDKQDSIFFESSGGVEAPQPSGVFDTAPAESYGGAIGLKLDAGAGWTVDMGGAYSYNSTQYISVGVSHFVDPTFDFTTLGRDYYSKGVVSSFTAVADGPLPAVLGITPRTALGLEFRREEFGFRSTFELFSAATGALLDFFATDLDRPDRHLHSAFAELNLPFVEEGGPGVRRLELSLGGRYDEYSDFGGSFNWTSGLIWQPGRDLTVRGSYGTAMRAPSLHDANGAFNGDPNLVNFFFDQGPDPTQDGAITPLLIISGVKPLEPEEAKSWSLGLDYAPESAPWARLSLSWFSIDYDSRIERPLQFGQLPLWLTFESALAGITTRNPTVAQVQALLDARAFLGDFFLPDGTMLPSNATAQQILDALPGLVMVDNRFQNLAVETVNGLDFGFDANFATAVGRVSLGIDATYTLDHDRRVTVTSPAIDRLDSVALPMSFRARGNVGWSKGPWGADLYVNYTPGYDNPFPPPAGITYVSTVSSWTTADLTLRFDGSDMAGNAFFDGIGVNLAVSNLFDSDPPFWSGSGSQGRDFDAANSSAVGRFMTLSVTKRW